MDDPKVALLLPSLYRPAQLARCLESLANSQLSDFLSVYGCLSSSDIDSINTALDFGASITLRDEEEIARGAVYAWNKCLDAAGPGHDYYVLAADDQVYSRNWLDVALSKMDGTVELLAFNDLSSDGEKYAAHWMATKKFLVEQNGGVMYPPMYKSWWADWEVSEKAQARGTYLWAKDCVVRHLHYSFQTNGMDKTYADAMPNYEGDHQILIHRRKEGFPITWNPIIS